MLTKMKTKFEEEAGADGGAGAGGADAGAGAADGQGAGGDAAGASGSVLSGGKEGATAGEGEGDSWLPEKFQVKKEDGSLDVEASSKKMAENYSALEKRMAAGEAPPKTPEEYTPEISIDGIKWDDFKDDKNAKDFVGRAHAKGLNNEQLSFVLNEWFTNSQGLVGGAAALDADTAKAELGKEWKSELEFNQNVTAAYRAFDSYASPGDKDRIDEIGNNPIVLRLLANIGKTLQEDTSASGGGASAGGGESIEALIQSEAYQNPKHADHAAVSEKVRAHFMKKYGTKASF